jgi:hypothetical protein
MKDSARGVYCIQMHRTTVDALTRRYMLMFKSAKLLSSAARPTENPTLIPFSRTGRTLGSWDEYHNQFIGKAIRQGIDNDERDVGIYPRIDSDDPRFSFQDRDYRKPWDDKFNRRDFNEPLPLEFDRLSTFMVERPQYKMWYMLLSMAAFLSFFPLWYYEVELYKHVFKVEDREPPLKSDRYRFKIFA